MLTQSIDINNDTMKKLIGNFADHNQFMKRSPVAA